MITPILATKLYIPRSRPNLVLRSRLIERINTGLHGKLTLISAPAGFGKTTLVNNWVSSDDHSVAWLSLDEGDNDITRFWAYVIAALQTVKTGFGESVSPLLQSPQAPPIEAILTALINEVALISTEFSFVLDDYHVIDSPDIDATLTFLLDHLPPQMHLIVTTREDPTLPLSRYRSRGHLTELRAADLRFTPNETAEFLNQVMGLNLSAEDIAALEARTEGWITGLQLAAISMQGRADIDTFIQAFTGSHHFILDYLIEEVLQGQSEATRQFLLKTSILERLHGPLCDAVWHNETSSEPDDSKTIIATLARQNMFVVPLDDAHQWYRYHHLFAEVLQTRLHEEQPQQVPVLHQRASEWYEQNNFRTEAIRHALAAEDFARVADLIELTWPNMHRRVFRFTELLDWLAAIPETFIRARPVLSVGYAWELLNGGQFEAATRQLQDAEKWMALTNDASVDPKSDTFKLDGLVMSVGDEVEFRLLPTEIASARAYLAMAHGDMPSTVAYTQRALDLLPETDYIRRGPAASLLGVAYWTLGDLEAAYNALAEGMAYFERADNIPFAISGVFGMADIRVTQGQLRVAISTYEKAIHLVEAHGEPNIHGSADLHLGLSELYREQYRLDDAEVTLLKSQELGSTQPGHHVYDYHQHLVQARLKQEQGDLTGALRLLDEAEALSGYIHVPMMRPAAALKAQMQVAQGQISEALRWVDDRKLSENDELAFVTEFEHMTLARIRIAQYKHAQATSADDDRSINQAMALLNRLLQAAEAGGRNGSVIEILILMALAQVAKNNIPAALVSLERALILAEPEGYMRIFVDEGAPMAALLSELAARQTMIAYVSKLLAAFERTVGDEQKTEEAASPSVQASPSPSLIEPLSERELDVLRMLGTYMNGPEIARELMISLNTMRTHTKNIYTKLSVNSRQEAISRAQALDLL